MSVTITDLLPQGLALTVDGVGLNQSGQAAGSTTIQSTGLSDAFSYQNGATTLIGPGPVTVNGYTNTGMSSASAINDSGLIVGVVLDVSTSLETAAEWTNGVLTLLPGLEKTPYYDEALAVNNSGQIVGVSASHAVLWQNGVAQQLDSGGVGGIAYAINDGGQIVGVTYTSTGSLATLWQNGTATYVAPNGSSAYGIGKSGEVVGSGLFGTTTQHAFSYQNGTLTELPDLNVAGNSQANAVNASGWVAGESMPANAYIVDGYPLPEHAVVWVNGKVIDLNSLLPANSGWVLNDAMAINDQGQIAGMGTYNGQSESFILTLNGAITFNLSVQQAETQIQSGQIGNASISDTGAHVAAALDALQKMVAAGQISAISLTDAGFAELAISSTQVSSDAKTLALIGGSYYVAQTASAANQTLSAVANHGNIAVFSGTASEYSVASSGNGSSLTVTDAGTGRSSVDKVTGFSALQFSDTTEIIAQTPGSGGVVTTGNIAELYAAVFGREPDVPGLAFYQSYLAAHPSTPLLQFAEWFLQSSEYASNPAHAYAQTTAGDTQFITDSYQNLLHRTPSAAEVTYYQTNVMAPALAGLVAGTQAYANAEFGAHALMLVYFSASPEFLSDVQITAQHPADGQHWLMSL